MLRYRVGPRPRFLAALVSHAGPIRPALIEPFWRRFGLGNAVRLVIMGRRTGQRRPLFLGVLRVDGDEYLGHMDRALFTIAMVQARWDSQGSAYLARKRAEGKTASEARRCLMRHLAGVVYRAMITDAAARQQLPSSGAA